MEESPTDAGQEAFLSKLARYRAGDLSARDEIVAENLRLVWSVVLRFEGRGIESEDLFQIGSVGLLRAIERFDPSFGVRFSTYAVPLIIGEIRRYLRDQGVLKISRGLRERALLVRRTREDLATRLGREPRVEEVAQELGWPLEQVVEAVSALNPVASLEEVGERLGRPTRSLAERVAPSDDGHWLTRIELLEGLRSLSELERRVLFLRFFEDRTQQEIADLLGTNQVRISRLERRALMKVRQYLEDEG
jgi:RNA polymerase sporulation-specific sigma factor